MAHAFFPARMLLVAVGLLNSASLFAADSTPQHQRLFHSGREGYPRYRIPSLIVTGNGTLLAICEGRKDGGGLQGNVDLVLKRSSDHGLSWSPLQVISDGENDTLGNPCAVLDRETGHVWLAFTRSPGNFTEVQITQGESRGSTRVFMTHSRDNGRTWNQPVDLTTKTKREGWTWYGTGPGVGIQLQDGRLLIPSYHTEGKRGQVTRSHTIFSDDHGKTWRLGGDAGIGNGECQSLQRKDGSLYLSARTAGGGPFQRSIVNSLDRGKSWSKKAFDESLFDAHCEASLLALSAQVAKQKSPLWLYCHPAGPTRHNLTVRISRDEGRTWPQSLLIRKADSQYSSMAALRNGSVGVFYDCWEEDNYQLNFTRIPFDDLPR